MSESINAVSINYDNIRFKHLSTTDGLTNNTISSIAQDDHGFIWIGTSNGLCRYDGYNIEKFCHDPNDETSIFHDYILHIKNDSRHDCLWIVTDNGMGRFNYSTKTFQEYEVPLKQGKHTTIISTSDKEILLSSYGGVYRYDEVNDAFYRYIEISDTQVGNIVEDDNKILWIDCYYKLLKYDLLQDKFVRLPDNLDKFKGQIRHTSFVNKGKLIFTDYLNSYVYDIRKDEIALLKELSYTKGYRCSANDAAGNIWIGTEFGIFIYNQKFELLAHYDKSPTDKSSLNDLPVYCIFKDKDDNMWVGTYFSGINYYISETDRFKTYPQGTGHNHLSGKAVRQIMEDGKGNLLITTEDGGLNVMDKNGKIIHSEESHKIYGIGKAKNVHSLFKDSRGNIWIGLFQKGVVCYNPLTKSSIHLGNRMKRNSSAFWIEEDKEGNIWYGGVEGTFKVEVKNNYKVTDIDQTFTYCSLKLDDHNILIGTRYYGLKILDTRNGKLRDYTIEGIEAPFITNLYQDRSGRIWIGTNNNGLFLTDKSRKIRRNFSQSNLQSNAIKGIIEDNHGNIWVGTGDGLCCVECDTWDIYRYTVANGLPNNQFNYCSACKKADGELYFGTIDGMISFYPEDIYSPFSCFNVQLTHIWSGNDQLSSLDISHKEAQSLRIEYSGMNYKYRDATQYSMKIKGIDEDWQLVGNQHQVRFSNLPSGNYTLNIIASPDGKNWDKIGQLSVPLTVRPPWWASGWAYLGYIIIFMILAKFSFDFTKSRLILKMRLRTEKEKRINIEKLNKQKTDFFTYISHDLKTPLTLILSPLQDLTEKEEINNDDRKTIEVIYNNAYRMNYLIDELLTFSKIEMKQLNVNVRKGNIMNFLNSITDIFKIVAKNKDVEFFIELSEEKDDVWFSPSKLERIIYNLLSNAFKYTSQGGFVRLSAHFIGKDSDKSIEICVEDSGRGIPLEQQEKIFNNFYQVNLNDENRGTGLGLALTKSLVTLHKGTITVKSRPDEGTTFTVTLKVSESAYSEAERSCKDLTDDDITKYNRKMLEHVEMRKEELESDGTASTKECIMIVEDNYDMNSYIADIFKDKYDIVQAFNGIEALKILEKRLPDLIISDVMMPKMNGLELLEKIKGDLTTSHIPVILLTAKVDEKDQTAGYLAGADAYVTKPFNAKNLELQVNNLKNNIKTNIEHFKKASELNITQITNNPKDEKFMSDLMKIIHENMTNEDFNVNEITSQMHISRSLLHNKIKALSGTSITQFIRTIKMKEAKKLLLEGKNVSETAYAIGMGDPNYFSKCFKKEFDLSPSDFQKENNSIDIKN